MDNAITAKMQSVSDVIGKVSIPLHKTKNSLFIEIVSLEYVIRDNGKTVHIKKNSNFVSVTRLFLS